MSSLKFCGYNGFRQFSDCKQNRVVQPTDFQIPVLKKDIKNLVQFLWSVNLYACNRFLIISGFVNGVPNQLKKIELTHDIKQISSNEKICLILLEDNQLYKYDLVNGLLSAVNFHIESNKPAIKRSIFGEHLHLDEDKNELEIITHIASCISGFVAITNDGSVYCLPSKIFQFPRHVKIKNLCAGFEHFLLLNNNGDVYSWGNGLRGQLGHSILDSIEIPQIIDALAGIKILKISAGGWHSSAISAFGDLYVWGNNASGQLGIKVYKTINFEREIRRKNPTVYHLPQIIDFACECTSNCKNKSDDDLNSCDVIKVACGARHTFVQMSCGKLYAAGWNAHNQLGIINIKENVDKLVDSFISINITNVLEIICGHWCTIFNVKKDDH